jgi:thiol-disulfide isomerase/thioredoxin
MYLPATIAVGALLAFRIPFFSHHPVNSDQQEGENLIGKTAPELAPGDWINSPPLTLTALRGKVVALEFWTYGCYNCQNTLPHMIDLYIQYGGKDFTLIGVHSPETEPERNLNNVRKESARLGILYPIVTDNAFRTWDAYDQQYWPTTYLIDRKGIVRYVHIGEGNYERTEELLRSLLAEK